VERPEVRLFHSEAACIGVLSQPFVPALEGVEQFTGEVLHSS
jgi:cation diffusion facilitator CzcD-associated flavoprotein CzcO